MYVYETEQDILVVDCGIGFPNSETPGVDIIIPDFSYILENRHKVRGVLITHGHDDHRGALAHLLGKEKFPVYAVPFVKGLIEKQLEEYTNLGDFRVKAFDPSQSFSIGQFRIHPFRVNHSIPDTLGFAIDTPAGRVFHNTDYKFDWTPVMDKPFEIQKAARLAQEPKEGVLALLSDCLGATTDGYAESEMKIEDTFNEIFKQSKGKQLFVTTISSNISRIQQAINASVAVNRKVVVAGMSIRKTLEVATEIGYIKSPKNIFVDARKAHAYDQSQLTYIIPGAYGTKNSGMYRLAIGQHKDVTIEKGAVVVFSADPIPGSEAPINMMINEFYVKGAEIYYSGIQDNLHVSGHGSRGDLTLLANTVKPKYYIPIGGQVKHMRAYSEMMEAQGVNPANVFQLLEGQSIEFENGKAKLGKRIKTRNVYVDGTLVGDVGERVLEDRIQMANHGMVVVIVKDGQVKFATKGFVFVKQSKKLLDQAKKIVETSLSKSKKEKKEIIMKRIERDLDKFFYKETGRDPLIVVEIISP